MSKRTLNLHGLALVCVLAVPACSLMGTAVSMAASLGKDFVLKAAEDNFGGQVSIYLEHLFTSMESGPVSMTQSLTAEASDTSSDSAPTPAPPLEPIGIDVALFREVVVNGRSVPVPVQDGEVLRDGVGRDENGDNLKVQIRANTECFVYVVSVDATGWAQPLFPGGLGGGSNPVAAHQLLELPAGNDWLYLDEFRGAEMIYFLASHERRTDLEEVLGKLAGLTRPPLIDPTPVEQPATVSRGFAGKRPGEATMAVTASDGSSHQAGAQSFLASVGAADLVVTRWFRHE